ncbi:hypothetical protein [Achromobacter phage Motura]|uniref:Uncharacterized protein n=1 Tax=Achromobacter phage Motura TaxID=2591403 RepID=A0A514CSI7_9CAUD|nr:hypothetical protein H1O15_gp033 [Achromobacter phage Motura]QDH83441.1 hypothetical protein [Achromobacter phage Motura]
MTVDIKNLKAAIKGLPTEQTDVNPVESGTTVHAMKPDYERHNNPPQEQQRKSSVNIGWITGGINTAPQHNASQYLGNLTEADKAHQRLVEHLKNKQ